MGWVNQLYCDAILNLENSLLLKDNTYRAKKYLIKWFYS
jgi:hypothetical protein